MSINFVICGLEHSGTTLLSDIFRQTPNLESGFEVGVLIADSPRTFPTIQPFYNNMLDGWQITEEHLAAICDVDTFEEFYQGLKAKSSVLSSEVKYIFDKTPRYFQTLLECHEKVQCPFVATYKDPRSIVFSDFKRTGKGLEFEAWYENYKKRKLQYLRSIYMNGYLAWKHCPDSKKASQILCVSLEDICLNSRVTIEKIFTHVGESFKLNYLLLKNLRYQHTRAPEISSRIPFEYLDAFTKNQMQTIEKDFSELKDWFYR